MFTCCSACANCAAKSNAETPALGTLCTANAVDFAQGGCRARQHMLLRTEHRCFATIIDCISTMLYNATIPASTNCRQRVVWRYRRDRRQPMGREALGYHPRHGTKTNSATPLRTPYNMSGTEHAY
eukprot:113095-Rhodomonas_salina.3